MKFSRIEQDKIEGYRSCIKVGKKVLKKKKTKLSWENLGKIGGLRDLG